MLFSLSNMTRKKNENWMSAYLAEEREESRIFGAKTYLIGQGMLWGQDQL